MKIRYLCSDLIRGFFVPADAEPKNGGSTNPNLSGYCGIRKPGNGS